jgi:hypothetical protein
MTTCCAVPGCTNETYMGWRPLTERLGRQICEYHWNRHKDPADPFDLFDAFGLRRPSRMREPLTRKTQPERETRPQTRAERYEAEKPGPGTAPAASKTSGCRACGAEREAGHTYCQSCARDRKAESNRRRQERHYLKAART